MTDKQKLSKIASLCTLHVGDKESLCQEIRAIIHAREQEVVYCTMCSSELHVMNTSVTSQAAGICQACEHKKGVR